MTQPAAVSPPPPQAAPSASGTLRRLFLTLFLRGRTSRGLKKSRAPRSIGAKLSWTLLSYAGLGALAFIFSRQSVFALAVYLHAMTFAFLGMFIAACAGDVLFNTDEADILLHRPVLPRELLWAKIRVLVEISLWLAGAFNLAGLFVGLTCSNGGWTFPFAHAFSTVFEALFCTGCVVMVYQLCLRFFGRERLDGLMTIAQILVSIGAVLSGQFLPQLVLGAHSVLQVNRLPWWIALLPPAWFAGIDDALAGSGARESWILAACAAVCTAAVLWMVFAKLARDYESGLQRLNENVSPRRAAGERRRRLDWLVNHPPLRWWLRDPVARASFLLTAAYLTRDRDVKLRVYPGLAPFLAVPIMLLIGGFTHSGPPDAFASTFVGGYLGVIPLLGVLLLQYSQVWQASDVFRVAPLPGPAPLCHGARRAVLMLLVLPLTAAMALLVFLMRRDPGQVLLLLPGIIALPAFAMVPNINGKAIPLSAPIEDAKSAGRGITFVLALIASMALSGIASMARAMGFFWWMILAELILIAASCALMCRSIQSARWTTLE